MADRVGEVVEASTTEFVAQCYELHQPPPFGSLVRTSDGELDIYGVVSGAATTSIEPGRRPIARGGMEATEADVYRSSPQLAKLLRTDFTALVVGYRQNDAPRHRLPPRPARIHSFAFACDAEEVALFTRSLDFLNILIDAPAPAEELVAAALRHAAAAHDDGRGFLVRAGKELAALLGAETNRLNALLRRLRA